MLIKGKGKSFELLDGNILRLEFFNQNEITVDDLKSDLEIFDDITKDFQVKKLVILHHNSIKNEARLFSEAENKKRANKIIAEAIVLKGIKYSIFLNAYLLFISKSYPTKTFAKEEDAIKWLEKISNKKASKNEQLISN
jgi:hypothetical protein